MLHATAGATATLSLSKEIGCSANTEIAPLQIFPMA
jgi:hypothetical protein